MPVVVAPDAEAPRSASTRELVKRFHRARELLADENYAEGSRLLQTILDSDEDVFFYPDQDHGAAERSLKLEAQSLLGQMPAAGRAQYERQHGPAGAGSAARRRALQSHDAESLCTRGPQDISTRRPDTTLRTIWRPNNSITIGP